MCNNEKCTYATFKNTHVYNSVQLLKFDIVASCMKQYVQITRIDIIRNPLNV